MSSLYELPQLDVAADAVDKKVHAAQPVSEVLALLAVERQVATVVGEEVGLHEHAARPAARLGDSLPDSGSSIATNSCTMLRGVKYLATTLAFRRGELTDEVLVNTDQQVFSAVLPAQRVLG